MKSKEIREKFLKYFEKNDHTRIASASLVPDDPTLYFANAGMVQFKDVFLGKDKRSYKRATTSQRCMRVSGKHNDLEEVGRSPSHHTFFEMLGNFSFGDYFKKDAIGFAWEFLIKEVGFPPEKLYITIFEDDDEAEKLWTPHVPKEKIFRLGAKDNFWAMGDTGPCGPCSEIHYDFGKGPVKAGDFDTDRFVEIWNLVFMQFNRDSFGKMNPLAAPSIDTGMGLERLARVLQGVDSNYDTDLFVPFIGEIEKLSKKKYTAIFSGAVDDDMSMRVIADHIRAVSFLISDGVQPSNEGRGYVLRRIIRRAVRHGKMLGLNKPFLFKLVDVMVREMGGAYSELLQNKKFIEKVVHTEEERFYETLGKGLEIINNECSVLKKAKKKIIPGEVVFKLYDTFGFPKDLTQDIADEHGFSIDHDGFDKLMEAQRLRARQAWKGSGDEGTAEIYHQVNQDGIKTEFKGYESEELKSNILSIIKKDKLVDSASEGEIVEMITTVTPYYGESGGQVGDTGCIKSKKAEGVVINTTRPLPQIYAHQVEVKKGKFDIGDSVELSIDSGRRAQIKANHTATHILHSALRKVLGEHVKQSGSMVTPDRLRFDFSHFEALGSDEILKIEEIANDIIEKNLPVNTRTTSYDDAIKDGALAFFSEKYDDVVRTIKIKDFSMELCGGTHVNKTGEIGMVKILSESSVAAGVRRIEAVTGKGVENYIYELENQLTQISKLVKASKSDVAEKVEKLIQNNKDLEKEIKNLKSKIASGGGEDHMAKVKTVNGVKVLSCKIDIDDPRELRSLADRYKQQIKSGIILLAANTGDKVAIVITVTKDLTEKYNAGNIMKEISAIVGGTGGGRPDMAQGGGPNVDRINDAVEAVYKLI